MTTVGEGLHEMLLIFESRRLRANLHLSNIALHKGSFFLFLALEFDYGVR